MKRLLPCLLLLTWACGPKRLNPLPLGERSDGLALTQRFVINAGGEPFRFTGHVELESGRLALVGLTPLGNRGFSAVWDGTELTYEHMPYYRLPLQPEQLVRAYQIMFLPEKELSVHLQTAGLRLEVSGRERRIYRGSRLQIRVVPGDDKTYGQVYLAHLSEQFTLDVTTLSVEHYE